MNQDIVNLQAFIAELDEFQDIQIGNQFTLEEKQNLAQELMVQSIAIRDNYAGFYQLFDDFLDRMAVLGEWLQNNPPPPPSPPPSPPSPPPHSAPAAGGKRRKLKGGMNQPRPVLQNITAKAQTPSSNKTRKNMPSNVGLANPPRFKLSNLGFQVPRFTQEFTQRMIERPRMEAINEMRSTNNNVNNNSNRSVKSVNTNIEKKRKEYAKKILQTNNRNTLKNGYYFFKPNSYNRTQASKNAQYERALRGLRALNNNNNGNINNSGYNANNEK